MAPIRRLLVANRGEIARRVIRTAHELGIETVAIYADGDADAPFVTEAGRAVALSGRTAAETYLDVDKVLDAARRTGADAVHPGYGFLSENGRFAGAVTAAGLRFVGPSAEVIERLGDKVAAKQAARAAGVPTLDEVVVTPGTSAADLAGVAYPLLVKAAAGGGGKGMRTVEGPEELADALAGAGREAEAAFGDGRLFVEPYLRAARHVEIQLLADAHGGAVSLFERECSIQRRHQKVLEESPSTAVDEELRDKMGRAALALAREVGYENAGTVEFLLDGDGRFYFLEVNTRLQVEHPVTEAVTGLDLVREQLLVAEGAPLSFGQDDLSISGHAIEVRLYAEDPAGGFLPVAGRLERFVPAPSPSVRVDAGVESGSVVGIEFDPMLAKVIAHAPSRREAAARLALALERTTVHGLVTNRDFLVALLRHGSFLAGETTTAFISAHLDELLAPAAATEEAVVTAAVLAALSAEQESREAAGVLRSLPSGYRMSSMPPERRTYVETATGRELVVEYRRRRDGDYDCTVVRTPLGGEPGTPGEPLPVVARRLGGTPERPQVALDGLRTDATVDRSAGRVQVALAQLGTVELTEVGRFPEPEQAATAGALVAPMPGVVLSAHVAVGDRVDAGDLLVVVEAMKMEHRITAPVAGTVRELHAAAGEQVASGDLLVALDPEDTPARIES